MRTSLIRTIHYYYTTTTTTTTTTITTYNKFQLKFIIPYQKFLPFGLVRVYCIMQNAILQFFS